LIGVHHATAARWLGHLCDDGVLRLLKRHPVSARLGNEFAYLHEGATPARDW
jgi:hypothetical protein